MQRYRNFVLRTFLCGASLAFFVIFAAVNSTAQTRIKRADKKPAAVTVRNDLPKITKVDEIGFQELLTQQIEDTKPLLINFWATWCEPCRDEFPDLVKIDEEFRGQIDFITVSLDDLEEIGSGVPKFLSEMNAKMPAYLLFTNRESEVIGSIDSNWSGGLPFSVLYNEKREVVYTKQGKIKIDALRSEISSLIAPRTIVNLPKVAGDSLELSYEKGTEDAKTDIAGGRYIIRSYGFGPASSAESREAVKIKYGIEYVDHGCFVTEGLVEYIKGYNEISRAELRRRFGDEF